VWFLVSGKREYGIGKIGPKWAPMCQCLKYVDHFLKKKHLKNGNKKSI